MLAACHAASLHVPPEEPEPAWLGPPERPFEPGEAARRGVEPAEADEDE
jgi:hypothetical protein